MSGPGAEKGPVNILLLGAENSGKTAWLHRFVTGKFEPDKEATTFIGVDKILSEKGISLRIIDPPSYHNFMWVNRKSSSIAFDAAMVFYSYQQGKYEHTIQDLKEFKLNYPDAKIVHVISFTDIKDSSEVSRLARELRSLIGEPDNTNTYCISAKAGTFVAYPLEKLLKKLNENSAAPTTPMTPTHIPEELVNLRAENLALIKQKELLIQQKESLTGQNTSLDRELDVKNKRIDTFNKEVSELKSQNSEMLKRIELLRKEVTEKTERASSLQAAFDKLTDEVTGKTGAYGTKCGTRILVDKEYFDRQGANNNKHFFALTNLQKEHADLQNENIKLKDEISNLKFRNANQVSAVAEQVERANAHESEVFISRARLAENERVMKIHAEELEATKKQVSFLTEKLANVTAKHKAELTSQSNEYRKILQAESEKLKVYQQEVGARSNEYVTKINLMQDTNMQMQDINAQLKEKLEKIELKKVLELEEYKLLVEQATAYKEMNGCIAITSDAAQRISVFAYAIKKTAGPYTPDAPDPEGCLRRIDTFIDELLDDVEVINDPNSRITTK